jgi:hypothetical protein
VSFIAEERQGEREGLHGYLASNNIDMGWFETSVHQIWSLRGF